jgi:hypothetical protein
MPSESWEVTTESVGLLPEPSGASQAALTTFDDEDAALDVIAAGARGFLAQGHQARHAGAGGAYAGGRRDDDVRVR